MLYNILAVIDKAMTGLTFRDIKKLKSMIQQRNVKKVHCNCSECSLGSDWPCEYVTNQ